MVFVFLTGVKLKDTVDSKLQEAGVTNDSSLYKLADGLAGRLIQSKSDNTNKKYLGYFKRWESFIATHEHKALPANPIHIAIYINHLLQNNSSYAVVASCVYSIKWVHKLHGYDDPTSNNFVESLVESAKRTARKPVCKKEPVTSDLLIALCNDFNDSEDLLVVRDLCMCLLSFAGFLRFNELSSLHCNDVKFFQDHFSLYIRKSKTDQYRFGKEIVISKGQTSACPYLMLERYVSLGEINLDSDEFLFKQVYRLRGTCRLINKNKPLSYTGAREAIIKRLKSVGGDVNFGLHSLRAGGATAAANNDVSERCFKRHGRWKSDSSKDGYVADSLARRLSVTKQLGI